MFFGRLARLELLVTVLLVTACSSPTQPTPPPPPPTLVVSCPTSQTGVSLQNQPVAVTWPAPTATGGIPPIQVSCTPPSGSKFPVGENKVQCTALDTAGVTATCSFSVVVSRPPQLSITRFLAFGDSITWGDSNGQSLRFGFIEPPPSTSYPSQLEVLLASRYLDQSVSVANEGWPGEPVADGLKRITSVLKQYNPQALLLLHGANDLLNSPSSATTQYIASRLGDIVDRARQYNSGLVVLLANFPPQTEGTDPYDRGRGRAFVPELNDRIASVARSKNVKLVDLFSAFPADLTPYISSDGLHPLPKGYSLMAQTFETAIKQELEQRALAMRLAAR